MSQDTAVTARISAPALTFGVLGPLQVLVDGRDLPLPGSKPRAVMAALLLQRNSIASTSHLISAVWNDEPPAAPASSLQVAVSSIRRALRSANVLDPIITAPPGYRLQTSVDAVDLDRFLKLRAAARAALAAGDPWRAGAGLVDALAEWTGSPLADLRGLRFADEFAAALDEELLITVQDRIECDLRCGRHEQVIGELMALTHAHPLRETLWGQLITALNRAGRQADALETARRLRSLLADELGIDPSPELQALEQRVLRQEPDHPTGTTGQAGMMETISEAPGPARGELVDATGRTYAVTTSGSRIGRMPGNEIVVDNGKVSRWHAVVFDSGSAFVVSDLASTNGTRVGGDRVIGSREIQDGEEITVGDLRLVLRVRRA